MKWKLGFTALALSFVVINPLDAARQLDKSMQHPRTLSDTSAVLQEMHGQMKLMQEQLGTLKASQQLLSAENAIKNLTPKVRKLEVHLERLEKQMSQSASLEELTQIKTDLYDVKSKLSALISAPDSSIDATLNALNPTLERMQKQVYYLYETVKSNTDKNEQNLTEKFSKIAQKIGSFEEEFSKKIDDLQATGSSLLLIRQALQQNHNLINTLKIDLESLKSEKLSEIMTQLEQVKLQSNQDDLMQKMSFMKQQIQKLAQVFKKSISSVESSNQISEKSLQMTQNLGQKVSQMEDVQTKHFNSMKVLYQKGEDLKNQLDLVKTVSEQNYQNSLIKAQQLLASYPMEKISKNLDLLKKNYEGIFEEVQNIKKDHGLTDAESKFLISSIQERLKEIQVIQDHSKQNRKRINYLYHKTKELVTRKDLEAFEKFQSIESKKIEELLLGFEMQNSKIAEFNELKPQLARKDEIELIKNSLQCGEVKMQGLEQQFAVCTKSLSELNSANLKLQEDLKVTTLLENSLNQQQELIDKLRKQTALIYKQMRETNPAKELDTLKTKLRELNTKIEQLDQNLVQNNSQKSVEHLEIKVGHLEKELQNLNKKLEEKDAYVAKLARRVAFLTKSLKEQLDQTNSASSPDLSALRKEVNEKIENELKTFQNDKMIFETLIQRVAALEASMASDETAMENQDY